MKDKNVTIKNIKDIINLSKKTKSQLRKLNKYPAYNGSGLTKFHLIFQIIFKMDSPK